MDENYSRVTEFLTPYRHELEYNGCHLHKWIEFETLKGLLKICMSSLIIDSELFS